jgi:hypothetical protein
VVTQATGDDREVLRLEAVDVEVHVAQQEPAEHRIPSEEPVVRFPDAHDPVERACPASRRSHRLVDELRQVLAGRRLTCGGMRSRGYQKAEHVQL